MSGLPPEPDWLRGHRAWLAGLWLPVVLVGCASPRHHTAAIASGFPAELVDWVPHEGNPLLAGTGQDTWDREIRERGFILREGDAWRLWFTGYNSLRGGTKALGYATSPDGTRWTRHTGNPVFDRAWTEDVFVMKHEGVYHIFAEGTDDVAHRLTSADGLRWEEQGRLDIRTQSGVPLSAGAFGTPTAWVEGKTFHLFYEREDKGIWLATSTDLRVWTNVRDEPVIALGPNAYDRHAVALNQVVRYRGRYYGVYHANADPQWKGPWTTCLAASDDLVHWEKYPGNPVIRSNDSSGVLVDDGQRLRLYTMHPEVKLWLPRRSR
jgi:beta-1,2-mannobiose phosphorylase / 1,2-beta-oligomannan phosphorylase